MPRLDLDRIICERPEDFGGKDEVEVLVDGVIVWGPGDMEKDDNKRCDHMHDFVNNAILEVRERDGRRTKTLGSPQFIWSSEAGTGQRERDFSNHSYDYAISYEVTDS